MRKALLLCSLLALLLWAAPAPAGAPFYRQTVAATQANTTVTVVLTEAANEACRVAVANDGPNTVYANPNGSVAAVASSIPILNGEIHLFTTTGAYGGCIRTLGLICDTGQTASVRVMAFP